MIVNDLNCIALCCVVSLCNYLAKFMKTSQAIVLFSNACIRYWPVDKTSIIVYISIGEVYLEHSPFPSFFTSFGITNQYSKAFNILGNMCHNFNLGETYVYFHLLFLLGSPNHAHFGCWVKTIDRHIDLQMTYESKLKHFH